MQITTAVVPAAGFGTRLRPLTGGALPKEMLPVGRRLALEHIVDELRAAGMTRIVFVLSPVKEALIRRHFGEAGEGGVSFGYALQPEMRGLGEAVLRAREFVEADAPFVVALGDAVFEEPETGGLTRRLVEAVTGENAALGLVVQRVPREQIGRYGVVTPAHALPDPNTESAPFVIRDIVEKPAPGDAPSDFAAAARYVVPWAVFAALNETPPGKNGEIQLTDALRTLLQAGQDGIAVPLQAGETRHDLGALDSYFKAFAAFALRDPEVGEDLRAWLRTHLSSEREPVT